VLDLTGVSTEPMLHPYRLSTYIEFTEPGLESDDWLNRHWNDLDYWKCVDQITGTVESPLTDREPIK